MVSQEEILRVMTDHGCPISTSEIKNAVKGDREGVSNIYYKLRQLEKFGIVENTGDFVKSGTAKSSVWRLK